MSKIKPGCLAIVKSNCREAKNRGALVEVVERYRPGEVLPGHSCSFINEPPQWVVRGVGRSLWCSTDGWQDLNVNRECTLKPFRDQPGNEQFVTEARNKLKGKTEITERGEVRV